MHHVSAMLANITPVCPCRGYVQAGEVLRIVRNEDGNRVTGWWVACPDCGRALGRMLDLPVTTSAAALKRRGYSDTTNANA